MFRLLGSALLGSVLTVVTLFGGLLVGLGAGLAVFELMPGSSASHPSPLHIGLAALPAIVGFLGGGALWGMQMGRRGGVAGLDRRLALAGMAGYAPITLLLGTALGTLEPLVIEGLAGRVPIHRVFTLLFVPTAFIIAGVSAGSLGWALGSRRLAWALLWRVGLAAALAFLGVNLIMEALGWVVGAPGAAERATMLTVMFAGDLAAAVAGGAVIGAWLARPGRALTPA